MFSAYLFWGQGIFTSFLAQRRLYCFILLPTLLYLTPSENDIFKSLQWITIGTIIAWFLSIIAPSFIGISEEAVKMKMAYGSTDIGFYVAGINFVLIYFYYLTQKYITNFSFNTFLKATALFIFIFLYQNRSMLIGASLIYIYSLLKYKSKYKTIIFIGQILLLFVVLILTKNIWQGLIEESNSQIGDSDYGRWKALEYYIYTYSPNWFCNIFGNGMPSVGKSALGNLYLSNMEKGMFISDIGMIGMWAFYGVIPLITIYYILIKSIIKKGFPLYLKFISFHIILIPTIFQFSNYMGILFFSLIIYLYIYTKETQRINNILCLQ